MEQIAVASDHIPDFYIPVWATYFKQLPLFQTSAAIYSSQLADRFAAVEGTVRARHINAAMIEINKLKTGEVEIRGDDEGTWWSQSKERLSLILEAFYVLFDDINFTGTPPVIVNPSTGNYGDIAVGQRNVCFCNRCSYNPCRCRRRC